MTDYVLGMNCKIFAGAAGTALASLTELTNVKDVNCNLEAGEADVTTRANSGWRATAATLKEATLEFEMVWKPGDTGFDLFQAAFLAGTNLSIAALTGPLATANSDGPYGDWSVTSFSRSEPLEEATTASVTCKIAVWDAWIEDGAEAA